MWYFLSSQIMYGENALDFLENISGEKCFIVTDKNIEELGYLKILTDKLDKFGRQYKVFNEVVPDPHDVDVLKARELCISYAPHIILALGGGSVIDAARIVWCLYEFPEFNLDDIHVFNQEIYEIGKKAKYIAIPTTSGTGAEATNISVISRLDAQNNVWKKYFYLHKSLIPTYALVDPIFPAGMPSKLTTYTAFDALSHALEGMVSLWKNEFSYALGLKAIELIFKWLPVAYKDGNNMEARDYLHQAATMAGQAVNNGQVHIGHTMSHTWGAIFHTPHGQGCGIFLNYVTQFVLNNPDDRENTVETYAKMAKQLGWAQWDDDDKKAAWTVVDKIKDVQKKVDFSPKLSDLGISKEDLEKNLDLLISICYQDPSGVLTPRTPSAKEYEKLFRYAYDGEDIDF